MGEKFCPILYAGLLGNPQATRQTGTIDIIAQQKARCLEGKCQLWRAPYGCSLEKDI